MKFVTYETSSNLLYLTRECDTYTRHFHLDPILSKDLFFFSNRKMHGDFPRYLVPSKGLDNETRC